MTIGQYMTILFNSYNKYLVCAIPFIREGWKDEKVVN